MRIRTRSLIIILSKGLQQASSIILMVVLVRMLNKETVGTYRQVFLIYVFLAGVLSLRLPATLYYFLPKEGSENRRTLLTQTLVLSMMVACIMGMVMFVSAPLVGRMFDNPSLVPLLRVFCLYPFVDLVLILVPAFMISLDRAVRAGLYGIAAAILRVGSVVVAVALGFGLESVMWITIIVLAPLALLAAVDMARLSPGVSWRLDRKLLSDQLYYALPLWATSVVGILNLQFDKFLISTYFDPSDYAVYSCGAMQLPVVAIVTASLAAAILPDLVRLSDAGKQHDALRLWQEAARKCSFVMFPCFAIFLCIAPDLMALLYGKQYIAAAWPFGVYLFLLPLRVVVYGSLFRAMGQTRPIAVGAVIALGMNIVVSTVLVFFGRGSLLSFMGPSVGTVCATIAMIAYLLWRLTHIMDVPFRKIMRWKEFGGIFVLSLVCGGLAFMIRLGGLPLGVQLLTQISVFCAALVVLAATTRILTPQEKEVMRLPMRFVRQLLRSRR